MIKKAKISIITHFEVNSFCSDYQNAYCSMPEYPSKLLKLAIERFRFPFSSEFKSANFMACLISSEITHV